MFDISRFDEKTTAIIGPKGCGKSSFMSAIIVDNARGRKGLERRENCLRKIAEENAKSKKKYTPPERHPIFTNYLLEGPIDFQETFRPYFIDAQRFGCENEDVDVIPVPPYSLVALQEVQDDYDCYGRLPKYISYKFETNRHTKTTVLLDLQWWKKLNISLREILVDFFVMPFFVQAEYNKSKKIWETKFKFYVFENGENIERFRRGEFKPSEEEYVFQGKIFDYYDSYALEKTAYPAGDRDFKYIEHLSAHAEADQFSIMYRKKTRRENERKKD